MADRTTPWRFAPPPLLRGNIFVERGAKRRGGFVPLPKTPLKSPLVQGGTVFSSNVALLSGMKNSAKNLPQKCGGFERKRKSATDEQVLSGLSTLWIQRRPMTEASSTAGMAFA
jgi:hypothetical protein